jgi:predicted nucleotidyltransferase
MCRERAADWVRDDSRVSAALVYGSIASGRDREYSDLDLVIVARPGSRDALWSERDQIAQRLLGDRVAWAHEVSWQRPYRYQAWPERFEVLVDLTFDEGRPDLWRGLADGFLALVDRDGIERSLRAELERWTPPGIDTEAMDASAWPWLGHLDSSWRKGDHWTVRAGLFDFLCRRVVPLMAGRPDAVEEDLSPLDRQALHDAAPASGDPGELRRAMRAAAALYERAAGGWIRSSGQPRATHPMARVVLDRLEL